MRLNRFAVYAWGMVAFNLSVIVWGAYVRASGAGAGCGDHWPLCNGEVLPRSPQLETIIELTHRLTSGLSVVLLLFMLVWAFRAYPKGHLVRRGAVASIVLIFTEALLGAALVIFGLVTNDDSGARAVVMSIHLVNTFLLLGAMALTAWWATGGRAVQLSGQGAIVWAFALGLSGTLLLAVSGALSALGDTLFPVSTLAEGIKQDFSPTAHFLLRLRLLHPVLGVCVGCYVVLMASYVSNFVRRDDPQVKGLTWALTVIFFVQLGAGLLNVYLLAPIWLQLVHLFFADVLWLVLLLLSASALTQTATRDERLDQLKLRPAA